MIGEYICLLVFSGYNTNRVNVNVVGQLGVSAYTFYDYNRALASVRVGLRRISPVFRQSEDEVVHRTAATMVQEDVDTANEPIQLKFILYKYCLENWDDETKVSPRKDLKEAFARQVQTMFDTLRKFFFNFFF